MFIQVHLRQGTKKARCYNSRILAISKKNEFAKISDAERDNICVFRHYLFVRNPNGKFWENGAKMGSKYGNLIPFSEKHFPRELKENVLDA